ncbi:MAG: universal stress protein [Mesorhizobium sp.]|nr:MAG: universal stress protein [Mesorhizobium sp.]
MIHSILHPSDLSVGNESAFLHGLRLALAIKGDFSILHSAPMREDEDAGWHSFPGVRSALVRWGLIDADAPQSAVATHLGVRITKAELHDATPVGGVLHWLQDHSCDLVVMGTHAREGVGRWLKGSIAADLAYHARLPTLFLPMSSSGFVDPATGTSLIRNVLIPIDRAPRPGPAVSLAFEVADAYGCADAIMHLLHVGASDGAPAISIDAARDQRLRRHTRQGIVTDAIVKFADELNPELIVMPTLGRHGFLDALRGSTTERVLRQARLPLLAVPALEV